MKRRPNGFGTITELSDGRFWVRGPRQADGTRPSVAYCASEEEAEAELARGLHYAAKAKWTPGENTFAEFGRKVFDQRELDGYRAAVQDRKRFDLHLTGCSISSMPLKSVAALHVAELARELAHKTAKDKRGTRKLSHATVKRCVSLVSVVFAEAVDRGLVAANPCIGVRVRPRKDEGTEDEYTFLTPAEQHALKTCADIPHADRLILRIIMGVGLRSGEAAHNLLSDVHLDGPKPHMIVRYGSKGATPKSKKKRRVEIFGDALAAFREWLEVRKTYIQRRGRHEVHQDIGLIFPTVTGCRRAVGKLFGNGWFDKKHPRATDNGWVDRLAHYYHLAGIQDRPWLDVHCLRHTCATSLLNGWWGERWSVEAVQEQLGHADIATTQRYAHHTGTLAQHFAASTNGGSGSSIAAIGSELVAEKLASDANHLSRLRDLNSRPTVYETATLSEALRLFTNQNGPNNQLATQLASTLVSLLEAQR